MCFLITNRTHIHTCQFPRDTRILSPATPDTIFRQVDTVTPMRMSMRSGKVYESRGAPQATTGKIFSSPVLL